MASVVSLSFALELECEVDHHDAVLLHDTDQQNDADDPDDIEVESKQTQCEQCADARRRQCGEDRDRMYEALIEHSEDDVHRNECRQDQKPLVRLRALVGGRGALVVGDHAGRHFLLGDDLVDGVEGLAE